MSEEKLSVRLEFVAKDADFHGYHGNAAILREAAQLARRVEEAPVVAVGEADHLSCFIDQLGTRPLPDLRGQRVRLVRET